MHCSNEELYKQINTLKEMGFEKGRTQEAIELLLEARHRNIPIVL